MANIATYKIMQTNYNASKKLQAEQDKIQKHLWVKYEMSKKDYDSMQRAINIEYKLTMLDEGHDIATIGMK